MADQIPTYRVEDLGLIRKRACGMIFSSGFTLSDDDWENLSVNDFGLGDIWKEGFVFTDILRSERLRVTCFVLLPEQSLPEHYHPPYGSNQGKEETLRVLLGETRIYVPGEVNNPDIIVPAEKERYYTVRHEIRLRAGSQHTIEPPTPHWFQGGPEGSVNLTIQNRVDETRNVFTDPRSTGCPIRLSD